MIPPSAPIPKQVAGDAGYPRNIRRPIFRKLEVVFIWCGGLRHGCEIAHKIDVVKHFVRHHTGRAVRLTSFRRPERPSDLVAVVEAVFHDLIIGARQAL